jgi:hypothetical protein
MQYALVVAILGCLLWKHGQEILGLSYAIFIYTIFSS